MKVHRIVIVIALSILLALPLSAAAGTWKPTKPIKLIVPWGAGGSTDQVTRVCAGELEKPLGQTIVVVNQPGASGSIGTKNTLNAPRDGYTWTSGAAKDLGTYQVLGMIDSNIRDWHLFLNISLPQVVAVQAGSPYKDFGDLLKAFKANPGKIKVSSAGINSAGHSGIETIRKYTGISYKHITYDGGNPAVIAVVAGEAEVVTQLSSEETDMLKAGKLRALAVLDSNPLTIQGYGTVPPVTKWIPEFQGAPIYFGIFIPKGVPSDMVQTLGKLWDSGKAKVRPDKVGIPKP